MLGLGHHHQAARPDIEALHDALPLGHPGRRDPDAGCGQVAEHGRTGPADARVGCDADRLVDHDERVVLVHDREALDRLRRRRSGRCRRRDARPRGTRPRGRGRTWPARRRRADVAGGDQLGRLGPRQPEQPRDRGVDPLARQAARHVQHLQAGVVAHVCVVSLVGRARRRPRIVDRACRRCRCRAGSAARRAPRRRVIAQSATLKIGQCGSSMKSTTSPRNGDGSRKMRSVTLPSAPPRISPSATAQSSAAQPAGHLDHDHDDGQRDRRSARPCSWCRC